MGRRARRALAEAVEAEPGRQAAAPPLPLELAAKGPIVLPVAGAAKVPEELAEPGRTLGALSLVPPALGLGDRLLRFAYRLGVPGAALHSPFRPPAKPRLLATVANPLPGDRAAGIALRAG